MTSAGTDYAALERSLKEAVESLRRAWLELERSSDLLPTGMTVTTAQERIRQARKMINSLRNRLDDQKSGQ